MTAALATIGHNAPPPYEAISMHVDTLMETAQGFLDGEPVTTQAVADEIGRLLDEARQAAKAAEEQRKVEAKPHDDAKAAVQALWKPVAAKCDLIASTAKRALAPFLAAEQAKQDALAKAAREAAAEMQRLAQEASLEAGATDLAAREEAEALRKEADKYGRIASRAEKGKAMVAGGARSVSLRSVWTPTLVTPNEALAHYRTMQSEALKAWLLEQAVRDVAAGSRVIPGFTINEEKVAQ